MAFASIANPIVALPRLDIHRCGLPAEFKQIRAVVIETGRNDSVPCARPRQLKKQTHNADSIVYDSHTTN
jgi:hypothetical protein